MSVERLIEAMMVEGENSEDLDLFRKFREAVGGNKYLTLDADGVWDYAGWAFSEYDETEGPGVKVWETDEGKGEFGYAYFRFVNGKLQRLNAPINGIMGVSPLDDETYPLDFDRAVAAFKEFIVEWRRILSRTWRSEGFSGEAKFIERIKMGR